ncbi:MAG: hypothetical protein NW215_00615 [Hyphomicrobiales bacterium]|nr:hypothetical protein [Hyphomicrobiales bacterium]
MAKPEPELAINFDLLDSIRDLRLKGVLQEHSRELITALRAAYYGPHTLTVRERLLYERKVLPALVLRGHLRNSTLESITSTAISDETDKERAHSPREHLLRRLA